MLEASALAKANIRGEYQYPHRGVFAPWALFRPPSGPRAYRFVFPTLLVASEAGRELYLFDVPTASLSKTIPIPQQGLIPDAVAIDGSPIILYVELGTRHVFVCTKCNVLVIPRDWRPGIETGTRNVVLDFPTMDPVLGRTEVVCRYAAILNPVSETRAVMRRLEAVAQYAPEDTPPVPPVPRIQDFTAGKLPFL